MGDVNEVRLVGTLAKDPDLKFVGSKQTPLCKLSIETVIDGFTAYHKCNVWREKAAEVAEHFRKGDRVSAHGAISYGSYPNKDGVKVYTTDVTIFGMSHEKGGESKERPKAQSVENLLPDDEDLPF